MFSLLNQCFYQDSLSTMESLGLLITLTLGGLGMFLVVLVVTFVLAKVPKLSQLLTRTLEQDRDWFL